MTEEASQLPQYVAYMNPILDVLRASDRGELSLEELDRRVLAAMQLSSKLIALPHDPARPDRSEVEYRAAWARTYLKKVGLIDNPRRGIWSLTDAGRNATAIDPQAVVSQVVRERDRSATASDEEDQLALDAASETAQVAESLAAQLSELKIRLSSTGDLLSRDEVVRYVRRFRDRFGRDALAGLDGQPLLTAIHGRGTGDSLVYWLEFKDDYELPAKFGGIGGGSALKFGLYQSAETGRWMAGSSRQPQELTVEAAIAVARDHRDQLVTGAQILDSYAQTGRDIDYAELQERLIVAAPDLAETSWGHKYFALVSGGLLELFHGAETQRYHLLKLLKLPAEGRYENSRIFAGIARQLGMTLFELSTVLHRRHGSIHQYWRVGTKDGLLDEWPRMRDGGFVAIGWEAVGDLSEIAGLWVAVLFRAYAQRVLRQALLQAVDSSDIFPLLKQPAEELVASNDALVLAYDRAIRAEVDQYGNVDRTKLEARLKDQMRPISVPDSVKDSLISTLESGGFFDKMVEMIKQNGELFGAYRAVGQGGIADRVMKTLAGSARFQENQSETQAGASMEEAVAQQLPIVACTGGSRFYQEITQGRALPPEAEPWYVNAHCYTVLGYDAGAATVSLRNPWARHPDPDGIFNLPLRSFFLAYAGLVTPQ